jgi:DNA-binding beta-propeller fold protein YncE
VQLEAKIPLGQVRGRIDHLAFDSARERVFIAELGNDSVAIVDLKDRKVLRTLMGLKEPQGVAYVSATDTLYIANGGDGSVRLFNAANYSETGRVELGGDADNIRVDNFAHQVFIGYGNGALAVIDAQSRKKTGDIALKAHPESFQLADGKIYANLPKTREIAVIDRALGKQTASWRMSQGGNFPMAINAAAQHVLVVFRNPAQFGAFSMAEGKAAASAATCADADDVFLDTQRQRIYIACGAGSLDVFDAKEGSYRQLARVPTIEGARTALFIPELDRLLIAARATASEPASLLLFRPVP